MSKEFLKRGEGRKKTTVYPKGLRLQHNNFLGYKNGNAFNLMSWLSLDIHK